MNLSKFQRDEDAPVGLKMGWEVAAFPGQVTHPSRLARRDSGRPPLKRGGTRLPYKG
jgi:hypothetical protein